MDNNETVTATSGAGPSDEVAEPGEAPAAPTPEPAEEFRGFNATLRYEFLECNVRIQAARAAGDTAAEEAVRRERERIAGKFVTKNTRLAQLAANPMMIKDRDLSAEHLQSALLGLWEAFVGTNPELADGVIVAEDGSLRPTGGWDPTRGTFATWAGNFISGQARRSVRRSEGAFTGMSYHTWGQKPKVDRARAELAAQLGRTASIAEIAAHAGVTLETVRACSKATPASLDAGVGDGTATLGDLIADTRATGDDFTDLNPEVAEAELVKRAEKIAVVDLLVLLLRAGVVTQPRSVVQTAAKLGLGRGSVGPGQDRAMNALAG